MGIFNKKLFFIVCIIFICLGVGNAIWWIFETGNKISPAIFLMSDTHSFLRGMASIISSNNFFALKDLHHSPGYQIYLAILYSIFKGHSFILFIKLVSFCLFILTGSMLFLWTKRLYNTQTALLSTTIFFLSIKWHIYNTIIQPSTLSGFLMMLLLLLVVWSIYSRSIIFKFSPLLIGIISSLIILVQFSFILLIIILPIIFLVINPKKLTIKERSLNIIYILAPIIIILSVWSIYQSGRNNEIVIVRPSSTHLIHLQNAFNPNSTGTFFSYRKPINPSGINYILKNPSKSLWSLKEKTMYLFDLKKDSWNLGNPFLKLFQKNFKRGTYDYIIYFIFFALFLSGIIIQLINNFTNKKIIIPLLFVLVHLAGPILILSSSKFLIPAITIISLYQSIALLKLLQLLKTTLNRLI